MRWHIGISGWSYSEWSGSFYPLGLAPTERLFYYAQHFDIVEVNNSFYHLPTRDRLMTWESKVPENFTFAIKAPRTITHLKKLKEPEADMEKLLLTLSVQEKPGPIIFQLPPGFSKDMPRLEHFLTTLPQTRRCAIEFRNPSWHDEEVYALLRKHNVAFCLFEKEELRSPRLSTADFSYVRLHGREANYKGNYTESELREWHNFLTAQKRDAYVFFDNTYQKPYAVENALTLKCMALADRIRVPLDAMEQA